MEKGKRKAKSSLKSSTAKRSRNRLHNPFDGSQRPAQQEHKSAKDYIRKKKIKPEDLHDE